mmetsp:Transcript_30334/g.62594  ORF Transcript_30334/g.62594 Transcript_30334/m.62594 type:complete len:218 (+) Transcript_30334:708-1361(+)
MILPRDSTFIFTRQLDPALLQVCTAVFWRHSRRNQIMIQAVRRDDAIAKTQVHPVARNTHGIELHVQAADCIKELQEAVRAIVPSLNRAGKEETEEKTHDNFQEGADTRKPAHIELCRVFGENDHNRGSRKSNHQKDAHHLPQRWLGPHRPTEVAKDRKCHQLSCIITHGIEGLLGLLDFRFLGQERHLLWVGSFRCHSCLARCHFVLKQMLAATLA